MAEGDAQVPAALTRKVGPLPVWGWGLVVVGGVGVGLWWRSRRPAQSFGSTDDDAGLTGFAPRSGNLALPDNSYTPPTPPGERPSNNEAWWREAVDALIADGVSPTKAAQELNTFLSGGVAGPDTRALADRAMQLVGTPPFPPPPLSDPPPPSSAPEPEPPPAPAPPEAAPPGGGSGFGDGYAQITVPRTWSQLAGDWYHDESLWHVLWDANKGPLGLPNNPVVEPKVGWVIRIPGEYRKV